MLKGGLTLELARGGLDRERVDEGLTQKIIDEGQGLQAQGTDIVLLQKCIIIDAIVLSEGTKVLVGDGIVLVDCR